GQLETEHEKSFAEDLSRVWAVLKIHRAFSAGPRWGRFPGPNSPGLSLASASRLLHRRSQRPRRLLCDQTDAVKPPSTKMIWPVTKSEGPEARNRGGRPFCGG